MAIQSGTSPTPPPGPHAEALDKVEKLLSGMQFGEVRVVVQDGHVVQVERTERHRMKAK